MLERNRSLELKVGLFVFIAIVVCSWFVLMIGDFKLIKVGYTVRVTFGFANGIKIGAPVRLAGVDVGEVKEIELSRDPQSKKAKVILTAWVTSEAEIPADSRAWVNTLGLLGEKYLEIIPGIDYQKILHEGDILTGEDPVSIQEVTDLTKEIGLHVQETLENMDKTLGNLDRVLSDIHGGRGTIGKFFTDEQLYKNLEEMFADLKEHPWKLLYRPK